MIDEKKQEQPTQEEMQKNFQEMMEKEIERIYKRLTTPPPDKAMKELAREIANMKHGMTMAYSHINQLMNTVSFLVQNYHKEQEDKSPVSTTNIDNKDLILEKDDDDKNEGE